MIAPLLTVVFGVSTGFVLGILWTNDRAAHQEARIATLRDLLESARYEVARLKKVKP